MPSHHPKLAAFEELALHDLDVKFGLDNYDGLKNIGDVMRQPSAMFQVALQESSEISQGAQAASVTHPDRALEDGERAALERLIGHAKSDTVQSPRVADLLLAWWDAASCGGFDLTMLWGLDDTIVADAVTVFALVARVNCYPGSLGYEADFKAIARAWRPALAD